MTTPNTYRKKMPVHSCGSAGSTWAPFGRILYD